MRLFYAPKELGNTLSRTVNLNKHIEIIRTKCIERLNVLRSLSYSKKLILIKFFKCLSKQLYWQKITSVI